MAVAGSDPPHSKFWRAQVSGQTHSRAPHGARNGSALDKRATKLLLLCNAAYLHGVSECFLSTVETDQQFSAGISYAPLAREF